MKHGDFTAAYCALCSTAHAIDDPDCDGLRQPVPLGFMKMRVVPSALGHQEGGDHYKALKIQPIEFIHANGIPFAEGSVIKYVTRWRAKNGLADLKKARHFLDLLIELEEKARG